MASWLLNGAITWLAQAVLAIIKVLWGLLSTTAFTTPDVSTLPQVVDLTTTSVLIVNACFVLAVITAGIVVMTSGSVQSRYGVGELAPRLVVGWIAANFAIPICQYLVQLANALTRAFTGDGVTAQGSLGQLQQVTVDGLNNPASAFLAVIIGLIIAALTGMLLVTWIVRLSVLVILVGISPVALACHATPFTDGVARLWWRGMLGTLATVVLQALTLHTALSVFLDPNANLQQLGIPHDPIGTFNLFIVMCLLWVVVKIPGLMRRYVTKGGGPNVVGLMLRMVVVQQLTGLLRRPLRRAAGAATGRAGGRGRGNRGGGGGGGGGGTNPPGPLPRPAGAGAGRVGVAWPTRRPVPPYTSQQLAAGVDPAWRVVPRRAAPAPGMSPPSSRPPMRAAGVAPTPPPVPRPVIPAGVNPATAMPKTRPVRQPVRGPWNVPRRRP